MSSLMSAPVWLVLTFLGLGLLILIGPRRFYERVLTLVHAWRGTGDVPPPPPSVASAISSEVSPRVNSKLAWFIAGLVITVGLPGVWRAIYRRDLAAELAELPNRSSIGHACRFSIRVFRLRRILRHASSEEARRRV